MQALFILLMVLVSMQLGAQDVKGDWYGTLKVQAMELRVVFHIVANGDELSSTMDSPDQGATGIPMDATTYKDGTLRISAAMLGAEYVAHFNEDGSVLKGTFSQAGMELPLELSREKTAKTELKRPQDPKDFPYEQEEVVFVNEQGGHQLAATLTMPEDGEFEQVVILITGSGAQNRDEELLGHKPFLVLSDYFTRKGIATLRYDDRGVAGSTGDFEAATSLDFASDAAAAVNYLQARKDMKGKQIGLVGHSEGGMIAPMVASEHEAVDFIVLLAGPGIPIKDLMLLQHDKIAAAQGLSDEEIKRNRAASEQVFDMMIAQQQATNDEVLTELKPVFEKIYDTLSEEEKATYADQAAFVAEETTGILTPWFRYFINFDPAVYLTQVKCPVLAVNGSLDLQVTAKENLAGIEHSLRQAGNKKVVVHEFDGLNHLFQQTTTGNPAEYGTLEETFNEAVMSYLSEWILGLD